MLETSLLDWYDSHKRSFPWRDRVFKNTNEHAYHTWVCEVMSQQTLLSVLLPKYKLFLTQLPNVQALHECSEDKLRNLWKGLGYYARARNLQKGAKHIIVELKGNFPRTKQEWEKIPGCGSYTSSIIASICYGAKEPAVDGNVIRVVSRLLNIQDDSIWTPKGHQRISEFLKNHMSDKRPGDFNQALMDLGATICKKYEPHCKVCPLQNYCLANEKGTTHLCPTIKPRRTPVDEDIYTILIRNPEHNSHIGVIERTKGFLKKTIGFPLCAQKNSFSLEHIQKCADNLGGKTTVLKKTFRHSITHHRITGHVVIIESNGHKFLPQELLNTWNFEKKIQWIDKSLLKNHLSSSLDQKANKIFLLQE